MTSFRFSIIIPTRDRAGSLGATIRTVLAQPCEDLQVIVSDNFSTPATRAVVDQFSDHRLHYISPGRRLSMSRHWDFALSYARGEWIGIIGDDDGLMPDALQRLDRIAVDTGTRLVRSRTCLYQWPELIGRAGGHLAIPVGGSSDMRSSEQVLRDVLAGKASYNILPTIYNGGFVHHSVIARGRTSDGALFHSRIPDVYSSMLFSTLESSYYFSHVPLAVNGASHHSHGTAVFSKTRTSTQQEAVKSFLAEENMPLHSSVPLAADGTLPKSIHALVLESFLQMRDRFGSPIAIDMQDQLAIMIGDAGVHAEPLQDWFSAFAAANGLVLPRIDNRSLGSWVRRQAARMRPDRIVVSPESGPLIHDVAEAAVVAAARLSEPGSATIRSIQSMGRIAWARLAASAKLH